MKTTLLALAVVLTSFTFSNCTTYVDPGVTVSPAPTTTSTTTTQSSPYSSSSTTTRRTTTTY